jgi:hypothetical protein
VETVQLGHRFTIGQNRGGSQADFAIFSPPFAHSLGDQPPQALFFALI